MPKRFDVGGQAVIEGVMMRSPRSFAVVCRRPSGEIVIKEDAWQPIWKGFKPLRWPFLRGTIVLLESLWNGISALSFAAEQQAITSESPKPRSLGARAAREPSDPSPTGNQAPSSGSGQDEVQLTWLAKLGMIGTSILFALLLFVGAPHLVAWGLGTVLGFDATSFWFHAVDGVVKLAILIGYLAAISLIPEIRRVFQYHGAEHKSIFTYEKDLPLTLENARIQSRFHPRCGTSFLLIVIMVSVVLFAALLRGKMAEPPMLDHLAKIIIKVPLMFPVAGVAYELIKLTGRFAESSPLARAVAAPGMWLQAITTREPSDDQLEIALISIRKTLWRERMGDTAGPPGGIEVFSSTAEIDLPLF
ncbi:MAG: DUF1385 domain-containing protein [Deltaproteobacteria bacterium]|nr:DUF1385 domain-containing protein [Deltaproteobacteria bacterium]